MTDKKELIAETLAALEARQHTKNISLTVKPLTIFQRMKAGKKNFKKLLLRGKL